MRCSCRPPTSAARRLTAFRGIGIICARPEPSVYTITRVVSSSTSSTWTRLGRNMCNVLALTGRWCELQSPCTYAVPIDRHPIDRPRSPLPSPTSYWTLDELKQLRIGDVSLVLVFSTKTLPLQYHAHAHRPLGQIADTPAFIFIWAGSGGCG